VKIKALARAKINLTLEVLGKRPDGYHEVAMVMQSIELHDYLEFSTAPSGIELKVKGDGAPANKDNLVYRAAELLQGYKGLTRGAHILLQKNIPVAAGLAGGSSDAAATLIALNKLWGAGLSLPELMELGARLGSDIPFCLIGGTALARGRGEKMEPLPACPDMGLVLVKPPHELSTARVYQAFDQVEPAFKPEHSELVKGLINKDLKAICSHLGNMLEPAAIKMLPVIAVIKEKLRLAGAMGVLMSGSGPTVYGLAPDLATAQAVAARYQRQDEEVIVSRIAKTGISEYISCD
jgi:4-diphosphocytidyl-2-C-methyl-D-erythritol kinase